MINKKIMNKKFYTKNFTQKILLLALFTSCSPENSKDVHLHEKMKHLNQDIFELKSDNNSGEIAKLQKKVDAFEAALRDQREEGEEKFATKTDVEQKNAELVAEVKKLQEALANLQNQQDRTGVTQKYVDDALDRVRQQLQDFVKKEDIPDNLQTTLNATDDKDFAC